MPFSDQLDRAIFAAFPRWGARRMATRRLWELTNTEANRRALARTRAAADDRTTDQNWLGSQLSSDSDQELELVTVRDRSRELATNDVFYSGAIETLVNNVVGQGIRAQAAIKPSVADAASVGKSDAGSVRHAKISEARAKALNEQIEAAWRIFSQSIGLDGQSIEDLQADFLRGETVDGDGLAVLSDVDDDPDRMLPLAVQVVNADRLETPPRQQSNARCRQGIERDPKGRRLRYWIRSHEINDTRVADLKYDAFDAANVLHSFRRLSAAQSRGWPWCTPALGRIQQVTDLTEAELFATQIAACYSVFITSVADPWGTALANTAATKNGKRLEEVSPGMLRYLPAGQDVKFGSSSRPGATFEPFMEWLLRSIAAGLNLPYELLARNYTGLSYSGGRLSLIEGRQAFQVNQRRLIARFLQPIWNRFIDQCVLFGLIDVDPEEYTADRNAFRAVNWITPAWPWVDPQNEVAADVLAVEHNLQSLAEVHARRGAYTPEVLRQRADERKQERELDIEPQSTVGANTTADTIPKSKSNNEPGASATGDSKPKPKPKAKAA